MTVGEKIKDIRENILGLSAVALAEKIHVSKQTLYKYENNIITNIPSDKIEALAKLAHISPAVIMGWESAPDLTLSANETQLLDDYNKLNAMGQNEALKRVSELTEIDKYISKKEHPGILDTA